MGGGGGPSPEDPISRAQVVLYRVALLLSAVCWVATYTLDFFMTSGIDAIDGNLQGLLLTAADACAGVAALVVPTGSAVGAGLVLRLLGALALGAVATGAAGPGTLGAVAGPLCLAVIGAREIFWFGFSYKYDAACAVLLFAIVASLRASASVDPQKELALSGPRRPANGAPMELLKRDAVIQEGDVLDFAYSLSEVQPIGPPVLLSFASSVSMFVLAGGKLFEPISEDLEEDGDQFQKPSSRPLYDANEDEDQDQDGDGANVR